jgi:hypothetical protein
LIEESAESWKPILLQNSFGNIKILFGFRLQSMQSDCIFLIFYHFKESKEAFLNLKTEINKIDANTL